MHGLATLAPARLKAAPLALILADDGSSGAIKVALVTGIFLVLAAAVTAWGVTRQSKDPTAPGLMTQAQQLTTNYVAEVVARAERAERNEESAEGKVQLLNGEVTRLRELLRYYHKDPDFDPDRKEPAP